MALDMNDVDGGVTDAVFVPPRPGTPSGIVNDIDFRLLKVEEVLPKFRVMLFIALLNWFF
jgi:hypothetical protein